MRRPFPPERRSCWECRGDFTARRTDEVFCRVDCGAAWRAREARRERARRRRARDRARRERMRQAVAA